MKQKLSILIYSLASGGAERVVSTLLEELKKKFDITLVLMNDTIFYNIPEDVHVEYMEKSSNLESGIIKLIKLPFLAFKYKKLCKSKNIDISLSFMNRPNYINIFAKILGMKSKVIISERAMPSLQHKSGIQGKINKFLISSIYKHADVITANSIGNSKDLENNFNCKNVITISNPFDLENIKLLAKEEIDFRDDKFTFVTVGRLDVGKNHKLMLEAIKNIDAKLYMIGDGELRDELEEYIIDNLLQEKVKLLGKQKNPYKYISKSDCFIFSSSHEGFPNVILEALSCSIPIISTDCQSGPREILSPSSDITLQLENDIEISKYGLLTPVNDAKSLEKAMKLFMNDKNKLDDYKLKAFDRANDFNKNKIIKEWLEIISN